MSWRDRCAVLLRFSRMSRIRGPGTRGTICWSFCSSRWRQFCAGRRVARTWPTLARPRKTCCERSCGWSTAPRATTRSAGCSACAIRRPSRWRLPASWRPSPRAIGSRAWWRSTARRSKVPSPRAPRPRPCTWSMSGRPSSGLRWPSVWRRAATRLPAPWKPSSCSRSRAASPPWMPCTAIVRWPRQSSMPRANMSWPSRRTRAACSRRSNVGLPSPPTKSTPSVPRSKPATVAWTSARPRSLPTPPWPRPTTSLAFAPSQGSIPCAGSRASPTRSTRDTSCFPGPCRPASCSMSCEPIGPSRTSSTGCSTSSSTRTVPEIAKTTGRRTSPCCERSLSTSCDPTQTRLPSDEKSKRPDGTTCSFSLYSPKCDSPACWGRGSLGMIGKSGARYRQLHAAAVVVVEAPGIVGIGVEVARSLRLVVAALADRNQFVRSHLLVLAGAVGDGADQLEPLEILVALAAPEVRRLVAGDLLEQALGLTEHVAKSQRDIGRLELAVLQALRSARRLAVEPLADGGEFVGHAGFQIEAGRIPRIDREDRQLDAFTGLQAAAAAIGRLRDRRALAAVNQRSMEPRACLVQQRRAARLRRQMLEHPIERIVQQAAAIGLDLGGELFVEAEVQRGCLVDHPLQRAVREPGLDIAAADVAVHARKPHLLHVAARLDLGPQGGPERAAHLVERDGMPGMRHQLAQGRVVEFVLGRVVQQVQHAEMVGDAERAHRVPHADQVYADVLRARCRLVELPAFLEPVVARFLARTIAVPEHGLDPLPGVLVRYAGEIEQAAARGEAAEAAHRVGAAAEPEQIDGIARLIGAAQPGVGALDIAIEAQANAAAQRAIHQAGIGADARVVAVLLSHAFGVLLCDAGVQAHHVGWRRNAALLLIRGVPGTVTANDDVCHDLPPECETDMTVAFDTPFLPSIGFRPRRQAR